MEEEKWHDKAETIKKGARIKDREGLAGKWLTDGEKGGKEGRGRRE